MSDYLDKIQTQKKDGTPLATVPFRDSEAREDITTIQNELTTDTTTIEGNPLNFTTLSAQTAKSTILSVEPIQDLHGYDKPWVGGAGKNKLPLVLADIKSANPSGTWSGNVYTLLGMTFTIITDDDNNVIGIKANGVPSATALLYLESSVSAFENSIINGIQGTGNYNTYGMQVLDANDFAVEGVYESRDYSLNANSYRVRIRIASGYNAQNIMFYPMIRLATEIDTTFAPYTNECSISGRTEIGILGCGKNFIIDYQANKSIDGSGQINADNNTCLSNNISVFPNTTYVLSWIKTSDAVVAHCFDRNNNYLQYVRLGIVSPQIISTNNLPVGTENIYIQWNKTNEGSVLPTNGQFELGNQATSYEPYTKSNDLTISLGQTVYGCHYSVENGVLVVDRGSIDITSSTEITLYLSTTYGASGVISYLTNLKIKNDEAMCISEICEGISFNERTNNPNVRRCYIDDLGRLVLRASKNDSISTASDLLALFEGHKIVYELATPQTIQLTPHQISLLEGVNNISTTGDKITLTYRDGKVATLGDLTSAVDKLDGKIEDSKILTDTATGDKYILVVTNGVLSVEQISD